MKPFVRGYKVCLGMGLAFDLHQETVSAYLVAEKRVASLYEMSPPITGQHSARGQIGSRPDVLCSDTT